MHEMGMYWDPTMLLLIPALLLAGYAQLRVKSAFAKYGGVYSTRGTTSNEVSRRLLDMHGLRDIRIEHIPGELSDHYDPIAKVLRLSDSVCGSTSIAAIGVAAHEVGHAIQDSESYRPLVMRNTFVPIVNIGSTASWPLFFIGLLMSFEPLLYIGIALFSLVVVFHLITLPVEFDASSRALKLLGDTGTLNASELAGAKSVLNAAALTYVAATIMSILQLIRLLMIMRGRRDD